jgi:hypothetical protein
LTTAGIVGDSQIDPKSFIRKEIKLIRMTQRSNSAVDVMVRLRDVPWAWHPPLMLRARLRNSLCSLLMVVMTF